MAPQDVFQAILYPYETPGRTGSHVSPPDQSVRLTKIIATDFERSICRQRNPSEFGFDRARRVMRDEVTDNRREPETGQISRAVQRMESQNGLSIPNIVQDGCSDDIAAKSGRDQIDGRSSTTPGSD